MKKNMGNSGFSLVELLVGIAILALLMAGATGLLSSGLKASQYNLSMGRILAPGRNAVNVIADQLRYGAVSVTSPAVGAVASQLTYKDVDDKVCVINYDSVARSIVTTIAGNPGPGSPLAAGIVQSLKFTRDNADVKTVIIAIEFNDRSYADSPTRTISSTVVMMNVK